MATTGLGSFVQTREFVRVFSTFALGFMACLGSFVPQANSFVHFSPLRFVGARTPVAGLDAVKAHREVGVATVGFGHGMTP